MPRNKSNQSNKTFSAKKSSRISHQSNSSYQSLYLWVSFLWSLITLGMIGQKIGVQAQSMPAILDLAALTGSQGLIIQGAMAGDSAGWSVASAGDVNGDNITDLLVGANSASPLGRGGAGAMYVIYGSRMLPAVLDLNALTALQGMVIQGAVAGDLAGYSVASAGDVNGDNITDLVVGADTASSHMFRIQAGAAYVIYGSRMLPAVLDLNALTALQGMVIQGAAAEDGAGISVSSAGDVNGDNISDLVIGAALASPLGRSQAGAAYLIYGSRTLPAVLDLNVLTPTQGMVIQGTVAGDHAGGSVSSAGDVNGDTLADLLVGALYAHPLGRVIAGVAYVIYGSRTLPAVLDLNTTLTPTQGMVIQGAMAFDGVGISVASAGDVNGDGITDMLVGANSASPLGRGGAGAMYVIYGSRMLPAVLDLNALTALQGMVIQGAVAGDVTGSSVSGAGDVNGDGIKDLVVGAQNASPLGRSRAGAAYVIYGSRTLPAVLDLNTTLTSSQGMVIQGAVAFDGGHISVASAGDVNGDTLADLLVGTHLASPLNRTMAGAAYLIYGKSTVTAMSLTTTNTLSPTTKATPATTLSINTSLSMAGTTTNSAITASTMPRGNTAGTTATTTSTVSMTGSFLYPGTPMTTSSQTSPSLQSGSTISSVNSMGSTTPKSGDATTTTDINAQTATTGENSGVNGTVIGATVGGVAGGIALTAYLAAVGFYAYRKKNHPNQSNNPASNNDNVALKDKNSAAAQPNYGKIDATKKNEKEYDEIPKLEI